MQGDERGRKRRTKNQKSIHNWRGMKVKRTKRDFLGVKFFLVAEWFPAITAAFRNHLQFPQRFIIAISITISNDFAKNQFDFLQQTIEA
jgi:hypothetical protein